ncbi:MAG: hypothetical protein QM773_06845 [Hyphomonadaceae bacterium]
MKMSKLLLCAAVAGLSLAACSSATPQNVDDSLKLATAAAIPGAEAAGITISAAERHTAKWTWTATFGGTAYSCDADEHMRLPSCSVQTQAGDA